MAWLPSLPLAASSAPGRLPGRHPFCQSELAGVTFVSKTTPVSGARFCDPSPAPSVLCCSPKSSVRPSPFTPPSPRPPAPHPSPLGPPAAAPACEHCSRGRERRKDRTSGRSTAVALSLSRTSPVLYSAATCARRGRGVGEAPSPGDTVPASPCWPVSGGLGDGHRKQCVRLQLEGPWGSGGLAIRRGFGGDRRLPLGPRAEPEPSERGEGAGAAWAQAASRNRHRPAWRAGGTGRKGTREAGAEPHDRSGEGRAVPRGSGHGHHRGPWGGPQCPELGCDCGTGLGRGGSKGGRGPTRREPGGRTR